MSMTRIKKSRSRFSPNAITRRMRAVLAVSAIIGLAASSARAVVINEVLAWNWNTNADSDGDYEDWIELYNPSPSAVNLAGYTLTDDATTPGKWTFPSVWLSGGGYLLVWASNKDRATAGQPLHANFRLELSGEFLGLYDPSGSPVDTLTFGPQYQDTSYGRKPDGNAGWVFMTPPTPGGTNNAAPSAAGYAAEPQFTWPAGAYPGALTVSLSTVTPGGQIRYELGGQDPTIISPVYSTPFVLTTPTVIRAQTHAPGLFPSKVATRTYLIHFDTVMPIISVVTDPDNLWGPTGIYYANISGPSGERPCHIEYWEAGGAPGFTIPCGLRIHGGASKSRDNIHKKSFRLHFRRERGPTKLDYAIFPTTDVDRFNILVLRANYNDSWAHWSATQRANAIMLRDELTRLLRLEMGDFACHGNYAMLFLNGYQWGWYNITERVESDLLDSYFGHEQWDILDLGNVVKEGDSVAWNSFYNWVSTHDLSVDADYQQIQTMMDLEDFTNYMIENFWQRNDDWPHHNGYVARARNVPDARWIFLDWDSEYGFGGGPSAGNATVNMWNNRTTTRLMQILLRLTNNADYRIYYAQQSDVLFNTILRPSHVNQRIDEEADKVRFGIPYEGVMPGLWRGDNSNQPPETHTLADWEAAIQRAKTFNNNRTYYVRLHVRDRFAEVTGWSDVTVQPPQGGEGDVLLHSIRPTTYPWTGTFYNGVPLVLHADPKPGYMFVDWSDPALPTTDTVSIIPSGSGVYSFYAIFGPDTSSPVIDEALFVTRKRMVVAFNKELKRGSAETAANYVSDHGAGSPIAALLLTTNSVLLEFGDVLADRTNYRLSVTKVEPEVGAPIPDASPATAESSFVIPPVAISEVMYNCHGTDYEWVELHNTTGAAIDVSGWFLTDDNAYPATGEGRWTLPAGAAIPPDGYLVVGLDRDMSAWNFPPEVFFVSAIIVNGGNLDNAGDNVALYTAATGGSLIDGSLTDFYPDLAPAGRSLEKADDVFPWRAHRAAWHPAITPLWWYTPVAEFATPGRRNGVGAASAVERWRQY